MKKILLFFSALTLLSCNSNSSKDRIAESEEVVVKMPSDDDYKIINSTIVHLVNPGPPEFERKFGYDNYSKKGKSIPEEYINEIYFTQYLVGVSDSLAFNSKLKISDKSLLKIGDTDFRNLGSKLISSEDLSIKLDTSDIQNTGLYRLILVDINQKVELEIGEKIITYSRIVYNQKKDKACFYFENNCSGLCGYATFVFVEKVEGIWTIKDEIMDWIS